MKRFVFFLFIFVPVFLSAQTAAEVELILSTEAVNFVQASRFVLTVADVVDETTEAGAAYALARDQGWLPANVSPDGFIRLGELCFLIMRAFNIKGSFLYAAFPGPRYAFRELDYLKLIPGQRDPGVRVSGERLLQILGMVAAYIGADQKAPGEIPAPGIIAEAPAEAAPEEIAAVEAPKEAAPTPVAVVETPKEEPPAPVAVVEAPKEAPPAPVAVVEAPKEAPPAPVAVVETPKEAPVTERFGAIRLANIQFEPNSAELTVAERTKLRNIAAVLAQHPRGKVLVGGYTAMAGSERGRRRISAERARVVADYLVFLGACREEAAIVHAYGAQRPLGSDAAKEDLAINRRVEITLLNEEYYRIQFMPDSAELMETEKAKLRELAAVLGRYTDVDLLVTGHTAMAGNEERRQRMSTERARVVANFLRSMGVRRSGAITVQGYGARMPLGNNATEEGMALNRRVEIVIQDGTVK